MIFALVNEERNKFLQMAEYLTILNNAGVQICNHFVSY
jgi:hypothetical protein